MVSRALAQPVPILLGTAHGGATTGHQPDRERELSNITIHNVQSSIYNARLKSLGGLQLSKTSLIPIERIEKAIYLIRGEKVMLDRDLARLYDVTTAAR